MIVPMIANCVMLFLGLALRLSPEQSPIDTSNDPNIIVTVDPLTKDLIVRRR